MRNYARKKKKERRQKKAIMRDRCVIISELVPTVRRNYKEKGQTERGRSHKAFMKKSGVEGGWRAEGRLS